MDCLIRTANTMNTTAVGISTPKPSSTLVHQPPVRHDRDMSNQASLSSRIADANSAGTTNRRYRHAAHAVTR
jgi:hypothetical protein